MPAAIAGRAQVNACAGGRTSRGPQARSAGGWSRGCFFPTGVVLFLLGALAGEAASADDHRLLSVACEFPAPKITRQNTNDTVTIDGCETSHGAGETSLPFRTIRVLLPPGFRVEKAEAQASADPILLDGSWHLESQRSGALGPRGVGNSLAIRQPDAAAKSTAPRTPLAPAQLVSVRRMAGCDIALVRVFPLRHVPASGQLAFTPRVNVVLSLSPAVSSSEPVVVSGTPERAWERVAAFVDNPAMLAEHRVRLAKPVSAAPKFDYLLVTRAALAPAFQPLVERKRQDGLAVKVETMEHIATNQLGRDLPEKLRNFIRSAYTNWGVQFVLLGGDTETVPCRYAFVPRNRTEPESLVPCDLYFACLDGSWNRDGNQRWGETFDGDGGDDVDLLAEVDVGRVPADTSAEVAAFVEKTVRYEEQGSRHANQVLLLATALEQGTAQGGKMFEPLLPLLREYSVTRLDDQPFTTPQWKAADAINALNQSPHLVLYNGHGDTDKIMRLTTPDLAALTNQDLFLAYSVGCNAGQFDNDRFSPDSIGEELVKRSRYGAFAAIFNSRAGWYERQREESFSGEFQTRFFDQLLKRRQTRLGTACQVARHEMLGRVESSGVMPYRWCYYEITLFGDPHLAVKLPGTAARTAVALERVAALGRAQDLTSNEAVLSNQPDK